MNERIKELAKQTMYRDQFGLWSADDADLEKFAELIVRECLTFVEPMPGSGDIDDLALEGASNEIKAHFGVQE